MERLKLFTKHVEGKEGRKSFDKVLGAFNVEGKDDDSLIVDVRITQALSPKHSSDLYSKGLHYPVYIDLAEDDYFVKEEEYQAQDGTIGTKFICYVKNYQDISQAQNTSTQKSKSLTDLYKERKGA